MTFYAAEFAQRFSDLNLVWLLYNVRNPKVLGGGVRLPPSGWEVGMAPDQRSQRPGSASRFVARGRSYGPAVLLLFLVLLWAGLSAQPQPALKSQSQDIAHPPILTPGLRVEGERAGGDMHRFQLHPSGGQFVHLIHRSARAGRRQKDSWAGRPEDWRLRRPLVRARANIGSCTDIRCLHIRDPRGSGDQPSGRYAVDVLALRKPVPEDQNLIAVERVSTEAKQLTAQGTAQPLRDAFKKYEEVLPLWRAAGERHGEAQALNAIGHIRHLIGETKLALEPFEKALVLRRDLRDRCGEGETLSTIVAAYSALGEKQRALEYYNRVLPIKRATGDHQGLAFALASLGNIYFSLGENQKALEHDAQVLPLWRGINHKPGETQTQMYAKGQGVPQDGDEAIKWYRKAAEQKYGKAQSTLDAILRQRR